MKRLAPYFVVLTGIGFFACFSYFTYLARISPTHPDLAAGLSARINNHGHYFYVAPWQARLITEGPVAFGGAALVILLIGHQRQWNLTSATFPRWLYWIYVAAFAACGLYFLAVPLNNAHLFRAGNAI